MLKNNGSLSETTIKLAILSAFTLIVVHVGLQLMFFFCLMTEESPLLSNGTQVCFYGAVKQKRVIGVLYFAAPILASYGWFLGYNAMSVYLLRAHGTENPDVQRRRYYDNNYRIMVAKQLLGFDFRMEYEKIPLAATKVSGGFTIVFMALMASSVGDKVEYIH